LTAQICHAIPTVFPFLQDIDRFVSFDMVTAVFRGEGPSSADNVRITHTTMQRALQGVSILSLMYYCEVGRVYFKYFAGIDPLMDPMDIMERVYLNIFWDKKGDLAAVSALTARMRTEIETTVNCQLERLRLFCTNDSFVNAFILTHAGLQFLFDDMEGILRQRMLDRTPPEDEPDKEPNFRMVK
jgi:hypothetical protein